MKLHGKLFAAVAVACLMLSACMAHAQGENRAIRVINRSSSVIFHLYFSNVDRSTWGPDQLGFFGTISVNHYEDFNVDDGSGHCLYDIRAVLSDGRVAETRNVNVCTNDSWTVYDK